MTTETIEKYLFAEYQKRGGDFFVTSKKISRHLEGMSTKIVGKKLLELSKEGIVQKYRSTVWKTTFEQHQENIQMQTETKKSILKVLYDLLKK